MLPRGKKSLAEIAELPEPEDRVPALVTLLEYLLVQITPEIRESKKPTGEEEKFQRLLLRHKDKFSEFEQVDFARRIRNRLGHAKGNATSTQVMRAEVDLDTGVRELLPCCPSELQQAALGQPRPILKLPPPDRGPEPTSPSPQSEAQPRSSETQSAPLATPDPRSSPRSLNSIWFILGFAFLLAAIVIYFLRAHGNPPSQLKVEAAQGPGIQTAPPQTGQADPSPPPRVEPRQVEPSLSREQEFAALLNRHPSLSPSQPNIALLIDLSGPSFAEALQQALLQSRAHFIGNIADMPRLKAAGFFDAMYGGESALLRQAGATGVDYLMLCRGTSTFRRQPNLDPDLTTCSLAATCKLADRFGTVIKTASAVATGPGFSEDLALQKAAENLAKELSRELLDTIP